MLWAVNCWDEIAYPRSVKLGTHEWTKTAKTSPTRANRILDVADNLENGFRRFSVHWQLNLRGLYKELHEARNKGSCQQQCREGDAPTRQPCIDPQIKETVGKAQRASRCDTRHHE